MTARGTLAIVAAALLCGVGDAVLILSSEHFADPGVWAVFGPLIGWSFVGTGLYAWRRRPESRFGLLMTLTGFAWFLGPLPAAEAPLVFTFGIVLGGLAGPLFGHVMLSFPTGRLRTPARRRIVMASYVVIPLAPVPALLVSDSDDILTDCVGGCPRNVLLISRNEALGDAALALGSALTLGLCVVAVAMLVGQWRTAAAPERRSLVPVFISGGVMIGLIAVFAVTGAEAVEWAAFVALAATPFAFLAGLARADLKGSRGVRALMAELAGAPERADLRDALARALGDPALELSFWMPDLSRYVDADGSPAELPAADDAHRTVTAIDHRGGRVAAFVHDRAQDTATVRAAGAAIALLLENQRLDAELRARVVELRASRVRLVEAADGERRRLERNLHDGAQSRLVALALNLRLARMGVTDGTETAAILDASIDELGQSLTELRDLARGIHPAVLSERGLQPAVRALAARAPVPVEVLGASAGRLPAAVETAAYFVVSEALTNMSKYARAARATVRVERVDGNLLVEVSDDGVGGASAGDGSGLRGLSDRVAALSGTLEVVSPPGHGTCLRAQLPCT
jgi:signal transduction histidine kinase